MVSKPNATNQIAAKRSFAYRNIKKDLRKPVDFSNLTTDFHLELGSSNEVVIVEDRKIDWAERANKDLNKTGLVNVLEIARRQGISMLGFAFKDSEAMDSTMIDPLDPNSVEKVLIGEKNSSDESMKKLEEIAAKLGVSVNTLVNAALQGTLDDLINSNLKEPEPAPTDGGAE